MGDLGLRMTWFFALAAFGRLFGPVYGYLMIRQFDTVNFLSHTSALLIIIAAFAAFLSVPNGRGSSKHKGSNMATFFLLLHYSARA